MKPHRKITFTNFYHCTRCKQEFSTLLMEVGPAPVCDKCITETEWRCECCHGAIPKSDKGFSIDCIFKVCAKCYDYLGESKWKHGKEE